MVNAGVQEEVKAKFRKEQIFLGEHVKSGMMNEAPNFMLEMLGVAEEIICDEATWHLPIEHDRIIQCKSQTGDYPYGLERIQRQRCQFGMHWHIIAARGLKHGYTSARVLYF